MVSLLLVYYSVKADYDWLRQGRPPISTGYPWTGLFRSQWRLYRCCPLSMPLPSRSLPSTSSCPSTASGTAHSFRDITSSRPFTQAWRLSTSSPSLRAGGSVWRNPPAPAVSRSRKDDFRLLHLYGLPLLCAASRHMVWQPAGKRRGS